MRKAGWGFLAVAMLVSSVGVASEKDHERARRALQAGQILPLAKVLQLVSRDHPGEVLEVELENEEGVWIYELRVLQPGGVIRKLHVDARNGLAVKKPEGPANRRHGDHP